MTEAAHDPYEGVTEFVGYGPAAEYLGLSRNTLSSYVGRGYGPRSNAARRQVAGSALRVFSRAVLDEWLATRPGQGFRSDRRHSGAGLPCNVCEGACTISD